MGRVLLLAQQACTGLILLISFCIESCRFSCSHLQWVREAIMLIAIYNYSLEVASVLSTI
mgnify:CR=1 FL=1